MSSRVGGWILTERGAHRVRDTGVPGCARGGRGCYFFVVFALRSRLLFSFCVKNLSVFVDEGGLLADLLIKKTLTTDGDCTSGGFSARIGRFSLELSHSEIVLSGRTGKTLLAMGGPRACPVLIRAEVVRRSGRAGAGGFLAAPPLFHLGRKRGDGLHMCDGSVSSLPRSERSLF